ncbi:MAG: NAD(P)H-dependent oxidoreductase [Nocardioidaceae bacterium]|nr:NAD(P)H-dependent oxidoreductase [Nocardioidaceae bacterium]
MNIQRAEPMNILVISGSSRQGSLNTRLAHLVSELRPTDAVSVISDLTRLPFYDGDLEAAGTPDPVSDLRSAVATADLVVLVTPEYNSTIPGLLANAVDWLSRPRGESVMLGKPVLVLSASPTPYGASWAAEHLRSVLTHVGAAVSPDGLSVGSASERLGRADPDPSVMVTLTELLADHLDREPEALSA